MYFKFLTATMGLNLPPLFAFEMLFNSCVHPRIFIEHLLCTMGHDTSIIVSLLPRKQNRPVADFVGCLDPGGGNECRSKDHTDNCGISAVPRAVERRC